MIDEDRRLSREYGSPGALLRLRPYQWRLVVYFPDLKVVHMGDLFTAGFPFIDYENGGSLVDWIKIIDAAMARDFDVAIPGHGPVMKRADLEMHRNKIEIVRQRVRDLVRKGVTKDQFVAQLKLDDIGWSIAPGSIAARSMPRLYEELSSIFRPD
jgi:glyoxylase-like metal-dependent hydrolase (beta-lactamase superfamily II)